MKTLPINLDNLVPFDDRRNASVSVDVISPALVRNYLADVKSDLLRAAPPLSETELYQKLRLTAPINEHDAPRNVALMLFTIDPTEYFPGARIEIAQFADDAGGDLIEETTARPRRSLILTRLVLIFV